MSTHLKTKKSRIAHGSKLSKVGFHGEPKLPPDDFVYNIMKDMDTRKDVISYQQLQEFRSQKRQKSKNEMGHKPIDSFTQNDNSSSSKQKKLLSKQSCPPLMKKCQKSLKYLKNNRCIPKPRAHVGFVPRPQNNPVLNTNRNVPRYEQENTSKITKAKQSKIPKAKQSQSNVCNYKVAPSDFKMHDICLKNGNISEQSQAEGQLSNSSDDDTAFEKFLRKESKNRKKSVHRSSGTHLSSSGKIKNKSKQKKKIKHNLFSNESNSHFPKVTSIPLSDSSESQSQDENRIEEEGIVFGLENSLKRKTESYKKSRKKVCKSYFEEAKNSDLSDDQFQSLDAFISDSSDSESNLAPAVPNEFTKPVNHQFVEPTELNTCDKNKDGPFTNNMGIPDNNDLVLCHSKITKTVPKYEKQCRVLLKRDPNLDKIAETLYSTFSATSTKIIASEDDDCIVISEILDIGNNSSPSFSEHSSLSKTCSPFNLLKNTQELDAKVLKQRPNILISEPLTASSMPCVDSKQDDCVMYEMPSQSLGIQTLNTNISNVSSLTHEYSNNSDINATILPDAGINSQVNIELPFVSKPCDKDNTETFEAEEFHLQIVAVHSLVESNEPHMATSDVPLVESNDIEVIDLSDDDSKDFENETEQSVTKSKETFKSKISDQKESESPPITSKTLPIPFTSHNRLEDGLSLDAKSKKDVTSSNQIAFPDEDDCMILEEVIQQNTNERAIKSIAPVKKNIIDCNTALGSDPQKQTLENTEGKVSERPERSTVQIPSVSEHHSIPDPKILEILSKIDFECIKEVINKTTIDYSNKSKGCSIGQNVQSRTCSESITMCENETNREKVSFEVSSTKVYKSKIDKEEECIELYVEETDTLNIVSIESSHTNDVSINAAEKKDPMDKTSVLYPAETGRIISTENTVKPNLKVSKCVNDFVQNINPSLEEDTVKPNLKVSKCVNDFVQNINPSLEEDTFNICSKKNLEEANSSVNDAETKAASSNFCIKEQVQKKASFEKKESFKNCNQQITADISSKDTSVSETLLKSAPENVPLVTDNPIIKFSNTLESRSNSSLGENDAVLSMPTATERDLQKIPDEKNTLKLQIPKHVCLPSQKPCKIEIVQSPSDELDAVATSFIRDLNSPNKEIISLLDLYRAEYKKYMEIKSTEQNVSAGLKLLQESQVKKLTHLRSAIKNLTKRDPCFYKIANQVECRKVEKTNCVKNEKLNQTRVLPLHPALKGSSCETHHNPIKDVKELVKFDSAGPSRENLYKFMMNTKCTECGKPATARCQGCAEVYYCSARCGEISWKKGHYAVCRR